MDSPKPGLDLERELTCSICAELLYQPLTLLDCLHTFCGACLKEWFSYQANTVERSPSPPPAGTNIFTCPSCRATVRDTRHNATVVTLLDMLISAHPEKGRSQAEMEEMARKYKPGDQIMPQLQLARRSPRSRRADDEDQRLIDEVRELSLQDMQGGGTSQPRRSRAREARSGDDHSRSSRDPSQESRPRRNAETGLRRGNDQLQVDGERRRRRRSESQRRQIEHQSSLRSLISTADLSERDIEREIEDFARQIQEEGLLEGLDLDNIDLTRDDELSRRITEAYRRRQRQRGQADSSRRGNNNSQGGSSRAADSSPSEPRPNGGDTGSRNRNHGRHHSRSLSASGQADDRSRPPPSGSANLDPRDPTRRPRRRTASTGRRATAPTSASPAAITPASRSQTDLSTRDVLSDGNTPRPNITEGRSSSNPVVPTASPTAIEASPPSNSLQSFARRLTPSGTATQPASSPLTTTPLASPEANSHSSAGMSSSGQGQRLSSRPADLAIVHSSISTPSASGPPTPGHTRTRSHLYPEPSITCSRCGKYHIEYEIHYNCGTCAGGQWNICLDCYRARRGCHHWFGYGYGAWNKWDKERRKGNSELEMPHMLVACRYIPPPVTPGGADGRKTLTTDDPKNRLQRGTFCCKCHSWTNECYWRCDVCNEGEWGFCNECVNQGKSCTHVLLPLTNESAPHRPRSPRSPGRPQAARILTGPQASSIGPFKPLTFHTRCDLCQDPIAPSKVRYHCYSCTSSLSPDALPGDYDICTGCYTNSVARGQISAENGYAGWRRCFEGHRMVMIGFTDGKIGQWRYVDRDLVGGRMLKMTPAEGPEHAGKGLQIWSWQQGGQKHERLTTNDVQATAPRPEENSNYTAAFPPEGGVGLAAKSQWAWWPQPGVDDELLFPHGAEIREIEDVNGDWYFGTYMGAGGLFPSNYIRIDQQASGAAAGSG